MSVRLMTWLACAVVVASCQTAFAQCLHRCQTCCPQCNASNADACDKQCCPKRIVIKRNFFGHNPFLGAAPPENAVMLQSAPFITLATPSLPVQLSTTSLSVSDLSALSRNLGSLNNGPNAASLSNNRCDDPCGDIKQLQKDVERLHAITQNLANAVEELAKRSQSGN